METIDTLESCQQNLMAADYYLSIARNALEEIRSLAQTDLAPDALGMSQRDYNTHRLRKIEWMANKALQEVK